MTSAPTQDACFSPLDFAAELLQQKARTTAIELELAQVRAELNRLRGEVDSPIAVIEASELTAAVSITHQVFNTEPTLETMYDPEEPEFPFVLFTVKYSGEPSQMLAKRRDWHERVREHIVAPSNHPRLCIVPE